MLYRDLAISFFNVGNLPARREGWDNAAWDDLGFDSPPAGETVEVIEREAADDCEAACEADDQCFSWSQHDKTCCLVHSIRIGYARSLDDDETRDQTFVAGWAVDRIRAWRDEHRCEEVQWVRPNVERVF